MRFDTAEAGSGKGAMLLAETGLLEGSEATTHWAYCDALAGYPGVQVFPNRALVVSGESGHLIMAGGRYVLGGPGAVSGCSAGQCG